MITSCYQYKVSLYYEQEILEILAFRRGQAEEEEEEEGEEEEEEEEEVRRGQSDFFLLAQQCSIYSTRNIASFMKYIWIKCFWKYKFK